MVDLRPDDEWWADGPTVADRPAEFTIPVGGGRRAFLGDCLTRARGIAPGAKLVLVTPRADLAVLWHRDLRSFLPHLRVGRHGARRHDALARHDVLVATPIGFHELHLAGPILVVVDEPHLLPRNQRSGIGQRAAACRWHIELRTSPATAPSASRTASAVTCGRPGPSPRVALTKYQRDVGRLLAGLLDGELEARQPVLFNHWAARQLDVASERLQIWHDHIAGVELDVVASQIGALLPQARGVSSGSGDGGPPQWRTLDLGDSSIDIPSSVRFVPPSVTFPVPIAFELEPRDDGSARLAMAADVQHRRRARAVGRRLREGTDATDHPYRGKTLRVGLIAGVISSEVVPPPTDTRADLVLPSSLWDEVDRNVHGVIRNRAMLRELGLGVDRGMLLHGPPGTGKTQLARVIAAELQGRVTAFFPEPAVVGSQLEELYRLARVLAPSLVVLEDIDLIAGSRGQGTGGALADLLTTLDGLMVSDSSVITIASTNDPDALDEAATRAARFDRILEIPRPPEAGRVRIWQRYLGDLSAEVDVERLARLTGGASGADVRELVRHAVLLYDGELTTSRLVELCRERGFHRPATGFYL